MTLNDFITLHLDLVNLKINKKKYNICINQNCNKFANFNYKNFKEINIRKCIYCIQHKITNMSDVKNKKCIKCNIKRANFNYKNEKRKLKKILI
jgi:hypothetical protein